MSAHRSRAIHSLILSVSAIFCTDTVQANESEFETWKRSQQQAFADFQTREDKEFVDFLRKEWLEFQVFQGNTRDLEPKPARPPAVRNTLDTRAQAHAPSFSLTPKQPTLPASTDNDFFGHTLQPLQWPVTQLEGLDKPDNQRIAAAWSTLSAANHATVVSALAAYKEELALGDWALIQLTDHLLKPNHPQQNQRTCYLWFLLTKLGYDIKIGYTQQMLVLLVPTHNIVYGMRYSVIGDAQHYMYPEPDDTLVFSYNGAFTPNLAQFDFTLKKLIKPTRHASNLNIVYSHDGIKLPLQLEYDAGMSAFLARYPQIDLHGYFTARPGHPTAASLHAQLAPHIRTLTPRAGVEFLLGLTQFLFRYQTDQEQFGREKYLLVDESLFYGTNDCEDRSIFLAWLIDDLLGLPQVVLDYPGHVALAVRTDIHPEDDVIEHQGYKYVVVDPTYMGANVGMAMPSAARHTPEIIAVNY